MIQSYATQSRKCQDSSREPLNKSMTTLAYSQSCYQDVLSPGLSRKCNEEGALGVNPRPAGPKQAPYCGVAALGAHDALLQRAPDSRRVAIDLFRGSLAFPISPDSDTKPMLENHCPLSAYGNQISFLTTVNED